MNHINKKTGLFRWELFNFINFKNFLRKNDSFATATSIVIATQISTLSASFIDNVIVPIFNRDVNKDGVKDIKNIESYELKFSGFKIKVGKFFVDTIKFLLVILVIFIISRFNLY
jgi:large-conductance mechanosensitive channel